LRPRARRARRIGFIFLLVSSACSGGSSLPDQTDTCSGDSAPADGQPTVALGRQVDGPFQALVDGDVLPIVHGPQGGQHVYVVVRLYARAPGVWIHTFALADPSGARLGDATAPVQACGPGWTVSDHARVFLDSANSASGVLTVTSRLKDAPSGDAEATLTQRVAVSVH
jgi:hypothetical protein